MAYYDSNTTFERSQLLDALALLASSGNSSWEHTTKEKAHYNARVIHRLMMGFVPAKPRDKFTHAELTAALEHPVASSTTLPFSTKTYDEGNIIITRMLNDRTKKAREQRESLKTELEARMAAIKAERMKEDEETFTQAELIESFSRRTKYDSVKGLVFREYYANSANAARGIVTDIKNNRGKEPYEEGTVVFDSNGGWYRRSSHGWEKFGMPGYVHYDAPMRPLTVPTVQFNKDNG